MSLDGFVTDSSGGLRWAKFDGEVSDCIGERISACDTALYGHRTYELMESYWPQMKDRPEISVHEAKHTAWYCAVRKVLLSSTLNQTERPDVTIVNNETLGTLRQIRDEVGSEILLFGSPTTVQFLLQQQLIDGFWLFLNPILLGGGMKLFPELPTPVSLLAQRTARSFDSGLVELRYEVQRT